MLRWCLLFLVFSTGNAQSFSVFIEELERSPLHMREQIVARYTSGIKNTPIVEHDSLLHFIFPAVASVVLINGDLQRWHTPDTMSNIPCGKFSLFYRTYVVPPDARLDYQFIIDGESILDPFNQHTTPSGYGPHSEVRMPKFISSPYLMYRNTIPRGEVDSVDLYPFLPSPLHRYSLSHRPLKIYTPPGYDTLAALPVLFVLDGFETIEFASLPTVIDNLIADKKIKPLIAVFIPPVRRVAEQMGDDHERFRKYLCNELVPLIDKKYKTDPVPAKRALTGISSGGNSALRIAFSRPDIFQNVAGQSTTITANLRGLIEKRVEQGFIPSQMKIYLDCGLFDVQMNDDPDFLTLNRAFSDLLVSLRIPHYYKEVHDGHQWASWRERMPEILLYFFRK